MSRRDPRVPAIRAKTTRVTPDDLWQRASVKFVRRSTGMLQRAQRSMSELDNRPLLLVVPTTEVVMIMKNIEDD